MAVLQSSGAISINDIAGVMGGTAPHSLSEYYRNGGLVPSTKVTSVRDPASGSYYSESSPTYYWSEQAGTATISWNGVDSSFASGPTSYTVGSITYYRGSFVRQFFGANLYQIYRTTSTTTNINANVPTSGAISLSNFYSAEKP
jgi:hypothetical protein